MNVSLHVTDRCVGLWISALNNRLKCAADRSFVINVLQCYLDSLKSIEVYTRLEFISTKNSLKAVRVANSLQVISSSRNKMNIYPKTDCTGTVHIKRFEHIMCIDTRVLSVKKGKRKIVKYLEIEWGWCKCK